MKTRKKTVIKNTTSAIPDKCSDTQHRSLNLYSHSLVAHTLIQHFVLFV